MAKRNKKHLKEEYGIDVRKIKPSQIHKNLSATGSWNNYVNKYVHPVKKGEEWYKSQLADDYDTNTKMVELKALSKLSLQQPLRDSQYRRMMLLARELNIKGGQIPNI